jgi:hypothetical protein
MMRTPGGDGRLELPKFLSPSGGGGDPRAPANALGIRHLTCAAEGIIDPIPL